MNLAAMPQNPDTFRIKSNTPTINSGDDLTKRVALVDTLHPNKEKKLLFDKVDLQEEYYPFGAPGAGAPLRNPETNNLVSRLPNINENLWQRYTKEVNAPPPENMEFKKREIHNLIDNYTQKKPNIHDSTYNPDYNQIPNTNQKMVGRFDPKTRSHIRPENYWNDWFGKPGAGAPNYVYHKQNLEQMLEPRRSKEYLNTIHRYEPSLTPTSKVTISSNYYDVPSNSLNLGLGTRPAEFKRMRSDHHNRYELTPR